MKNSSLFLAKTELGCYKTYLKHLIVRITAFQRNSDFEISGLAISEKIAMSKPCHDVRLILKHTCPLRGGKTMGLCMLLRATLTPPVAPVPRKGAPEVKEVSFDIN